MSPPTSHCEQLVWIVPERWAPAGRVLAWTCDCEPTFYELRQACGLRFIRRIEKRNALVEESDRWRAGIAAAQWNALLMGHLR